MRLPAQNELGISCVVLIYNNMCDVCCCLVHIWTSYFHWYFFKSFLSKHQTHTHKNKAHNNKLIMLFSRCCPQIDYELSKKHPINTFGMLSHYEIRIGESAVKWSHRKYLKNYRNATKIINSGEQMRNFTSRLSIYTDVHRSLGCIEIGSIPGTRWLHWESSSDSVHFREYWLGGNLENNAVVIQLAGPMMMFHIFMHC